MDKFYEDVRCFLVDNDILDNPCRIYNIDESWYSGRNETKQKKVLVPKDMHVPYVLSNVSIDHITITLCICATGDISPPMLTFAKSYPSDHDFHALGPKNACYTVTESGHIDVQLFKIFQTS